MGLVDYESESSGSESAAPAKTAAKPTAASKKPFQKVVDRSNPGKIVVNLPQAVADGGKDAAGGDEPPAKRARTAGGGLFAGFNSLLPAPKNAAKAPPTPTATRARVGVSLKTSAAPGFSRDEEAGGYENAPAGDPGLGIPLAKPQAEPSIPEELKPADEVKLVGKPLMFRPLSVARSANKKKGPKAGAAKSASAMATEQEAGPSCTEAQPRSGRAPEKMPLFSMYMEEPSETPASQKPSNTYEPLFETGLAPEDALDGYDAQSTAQAVQGAAPTTGPGADSLDSIARDLNLSAAARRELFGRGGGGNQTAKKVINFNLDQEYRHNEAVRAAGDQQVHNPVRAIQGGKHSLRQLVQNVQNQREALEESFAKGKSNRREASSRYGW